MCNDAQRGNARELVEAAHVDGAGVLGIYRRVILPLSVPGFVVVGIWQFTSIWNEFGPRPRGRDIVLTGVMTHAIAVERVAAAVRLRGLYP